MCYQHIIQRNEVNTASEAKQTKVFGNEEPLKTDNTEKGTDNTKEDDSENAKEKLKDISNAFKTLIFDIVMNIIHMIF